MGLRPGWLATLGGEAPASGPPRIHRVEAKEALELTLG
jgi:hypothetical protein